LVTLNWEFGRNSTCVSRWALCTGRQ
jgi:hypothetical protein